MIKHNIIYKTWYVIIAIVITNTAFLHTAETFDIHKFLSSQDIPSENEAWQFISFLDTLNKGCEKSDKLSTPCIQLNSIVNNGTLVTQSEKILNNNKINATDKKILANTYFEIRFNNRIFHPEKLPMTPLVKSHLSGTHRLPLEIQENDPAQWNNSTLAKKAELSLTAIETLGKIIMTGNISKDYISQTTLHTNLLEYLKNINTALSDTSNTLRPMFAQNIHTNKKHLINLLLKTGDSDENLSPEIGPEYDALVQNLSHYNITFPHIPTVFQKKDSSEISTSPSSDPAKPVTPQMTPELAAASHHFAQQTQPLPTYQPPTTTQQQPTVYKQPAQPMPQPQFQQPAPAYQPQLTYQQNPIINNPQPTTYGQPTQQNQWQPIPNVPAQQPVQQNLELEHYASLPKLNTPLNSTKLDPIDFTTTQQRLKKEINELNSILANPKNIETKQTLFSKMNAIVVDAQSVGTAIDAFKIYELVQVLRIENPNFKLRASLNRKDRNQGIFNLQERDNLASIISSDQSRSTIANVITHIDTFFVIGCNNRYRDIFITKVSELANYQPDNVIDSYKNKIIENDYFKTVCNFLIKRAHFPKQQELKDAYQKLYPLSQANPAIPSPANKKPVVWNIPVHPKPMIPNSNQPNVFQKPMNPTIPVVPTVKSQDPQQPNQKVVNPHSNAQPSDSSGSGSWSFWAVASSIGSGIGSLFSGIWSGISAGASWLGSLLTK